MHWGERCDSNTHARVPGTAIAISNRLMNAADKVGGYSYTGTFCGGINVCMGCGRLDAQGAIN